MNEETEIEKLALKRGAGDSTLPEAYIEIATMDGTGDTKRIWDKNNPDEVEDARASFDRLRAKGYLAFHVTGKDGERGEQMTKFDPNAERMILVPAFKGG